MPKGQPTFALRYPLRREDIDPESCLHVKWEATAKSALTYYVRFSADGTKWFRVAVNLQREDYVLDLRLLPGGQQCRLQVLATNGYRTHYVELPPFALAQKLPELLIGDPSGPALFAQGFSYEHGPIVGDSILWLSDGHGVARGGRFDVRGLREGVHEVAVALSIAGKERHREIVGRYDGATGRMVGHRG